MKDLAPEIPVEDTPLSCQNNMWIPPTIPHVYKAISAVTKALSKDGVAKNKKNDQQGYKFRGIDDMYNALSIPLAEAGLCILPRMVERSKEERETAKGGVLFYVTVKAEFDFVSSQDGSKHTVVMYGEAMDSADKATNKAMSAAYKYCAMQVFCIPTEGMEDADATTHEPAPKSVAQNGADVAQFKPKPDKKTKHTPEQTSVVEEKLRESVLNFLEAMRKKFAIAGNEDRYWGIMGTHGFSHPSEVPADPSNNGAKNLFNDLKTAFQDMVTQAGQ